MEFAKPEYSKRKIVAAGKALSVPIPDDKSSIEAALETFKIAHNWRDSYVYPMRRVRAELYGKIRQLKYSAISAARLKRMVSIKKKLRSTPITLFQMQDIGGARAIIDDIENLDRIVQLYLDGDTAHKVIRDDNYLIEPKTTGYRSRHLVLKFQDPEGQEEYNRQFVEVQFRTRLQHAWATAVEAVGMVRGEDTKAGKGDTDWLRLFEIMACEFAEKEERPLVSGVSTNRIERRNELVEIDKRIHALTTLQSYNSAIKETENYYNISSPYYLIQYNIDTKNVGVKPFNIPKAGSSEYATAEQDKRINSVLVEVEKVADLREAYPNYFLDVGIFTQHLKQITYGGNAQDFQDIHWWEIPKYFS